MIYLALALLQLDMSKWLLFYDALFIMHWSYFECWEFYQTGLHIQPLSQDFHFVHCYSPVDYSGPVSTMLVNAKCYVVFISINTD